MELRDPTHLYEGEISPKAERIANAISVIGQPIFIPIPVFALICLVIGDAAEYAKILAISLLFVAVLPTVITYYFSIKMGRKDGDIPDRTKRYIPMAIGIVSYAIGSAVLYLADAPRIVTVLMVCYAVVTAVMLIVTFYWKISIHAVGVVGPTMALAYVYWPWGLLFGLLFIPIAWSRYVLKRHTPAQLLAGALVGIIVSGAIFWFAL